MRCHCLSPQGAPSAEPVRQESSENPENPEDPGGANGANPGGAGGAHDDPMRDCAADGAEFMIHRVLRLSARRRVDGTCSARKLVSPLRSVERSSARSRFLERKESCHNLASIVSSLAVTEKMCCRSCVSKCRNISTGCLAATDVDRKGASNKRVRT